jgi:hypothetical protein
MKLYDKVSSLRGAKILLHGQQINGQTHREGRSPKVVTEQTTEERSKERPETQIKEDKRTRAEEPGPLRDTTSEGHSTL